MHNTLACTVQGDLPPNIGQGIPVQSTKQKKPQKTNEQKKNLAWQKLGIAILKPFLGWGVEPGNSLFEI